MSVRFLAYSCKHVPLHDESAINWLCQRISEHKPEYLIDLGDGIEADAALRWKDQSEHHWSLADEYAAHCRVLKTLREAAAKTTTCVYLPGNHDDNIVAAGRICPKLRELVDWRSPKNQPELAHWTIGAQYKHCRTRGAYRIGQVVFAHGYECSSNSDESQALYFANEYGLFVSGHTHRPTPGIMQARRTASLPLRYWYANVGCMRTMDASYMDRKRKMLWGQAIVVGDAEPIKSPRVGRRWSAHVETYRMYDQWAGDVA